PSPAHTSPLSLHDALPISGGAHPPVRDEQLGDLLVHGQGLDVGGGALGGGEPPVVDGGHLAGAVDVLKGQAVLLDDAAGHRADGDRKSTRLNSSHVSISYA